MRKKTYQELREEFLELREQYEQIGEPKFSIQICTQVSDPPYTDIENFRPITSVGLPLKDGYIPDPVQNEDFSTLGVALVPRTNETSQICIRFIELGRKAGVHLPRKITRQLNGLSPDSLDDPLSKWLALLIDLNEFYLGNSVIARPFLNSIEAIDRCGLAEDKPYCFI